MNVTARGFYVRFWPKADMGQLRRTCLLLSVKRTVPIASDNRVYRMLRFMFPIVGSGASQQA